jgi:hypothetical protein
MSHLPLKFIKELKKDNIFIDIREHAIFAIRNLLIHNPENQKLVEQLVPIETVQHPDLQDAGIMTELGSDGKIKFSSRNVQK